MAQSSVTYEYDALGRLTDTDYSDGAAQEFNFDAAGNRTSVLTNGATVSVYSVADTASGEGSNEVFTVTRSGDVSLAETVQYATANGTASSGADYSTTSGTLSFAAAQTSKTVNVTTVSDSIDEADETVLLILSSPSGGGLLQRAQAAGTINDDDASPSFAVNDVSVLEGGQLSFSVTKTGSTEQTYSVDYATADGTAVASSDYTAASGTLSFTPAQASQTAAVSTVQDTNVEADETLQLNLTNPLGASTIVDNQGIGTITNDDSTNSPPNAVNNSYNYVVPWNAPVPDKYIYPLGNDTDPDSDPLTIISITQPPSGVIATINTTTRIKLDINNTIYSGSFTYTISDGNGGTDTATIFLNVEEEEEE